MSKRDSKKIPVSRAAIAPTVWASGFESVKTELTVSEVKQDMKLAIRRYRRRKSGRK